jgi:hypothetical protein
MVSPIGGAEVQPACPPIDRSHQGADCRTVVDNGHRKPEPPQLGQLNYYNGPITGYLNHASVQAMIINYDDPGHPARACGFVRSQSCGQIVGLLMARADGCVCGRGVPHHRPITSAGGVARV